MNRHTSALALLCAAAFAALLMPSRLAAQSPDGATVVDVHGERVTLAADPRVEAESVSWSTGVAYTYDGSGNVRQIGTDSFVYDAVGRLVQSDANGIRRNYEYDAFGNRTRCRQSAGTANESDCQFGYTMNAHTNRISEASYDAAGNVTGLAGRTYSYDALNMLTREQSGGLAREYIYTADDERIAIYEVGSRWRWTVRDTAGKVLREFTSADGPNGLGTADWKWSKDYIWRDGLLLATRQIEPGTSTTPVTYHYHLDHLGPPRRITDGADRIVGIHDYHAFGPEVSGGQNEPSLSLMKFTGHERDLWGAEASWDTLDYMHARYASGTLGRFLSVDPILGIPPAPQSWNRYAYVLNNPVAALDPDGRRAAMFYGQVLDVEPGYVVVLGNRFTGRPNHAVMIVGFNRAFDGTLSATLVEHLPREGNRMSRSGGFAPDTQRHKLAIADSNSPQAGGAYWNITRDRPLAVIPNRTVTGGYHTTEAVMSAVAVVNAEGGLTYNNLSAGDTCSFTTDCAGAVDRLLMLLDGTLDSGARLFTSPGQGYNFYDFLNMPTAQKVPCPQGETPCD